MPYNKDGSKKKNPSKQDWYSYHLRKDKNKGFKSGSKSSASNAGGASVGG